MADNGTRTAIEVPGIGRGYLISMPDAKEDQFMFKLPCENWGEHEPWRICFDDVLAVVNGIVSKN